jgi:hypothetical protein
MTRTSTNDTAIRVAVADEYRQLAEDLALFLCGRTLPPR